MAADTIHVPSDGTQKEQRDAKNIESTWPLLLLLLLLHCSLQWLLFQGAVTSTANSSVTM